jgi:hypothetical protein
MRLTLEDCRWNSRAANLLTVRTLWGTETAVCSSELRCNNPVVSKARYLVLSWAV